MLLDCLPSQISYFVSLFHVTWTLYKKKLHKVSDEYLYRQNQVLGKGYETPV